MKKILCSILLLAIVLSAITCPSHTDAANFGNDYKNWSQGGSDYADMRSYGCWVTAQAKLLYETNIDRTLNPDSYYLWQKANGLIDSRFYQTNGGNAPSIYASQKGKELNYLGEWACNADQLWFNISAGYYTIVKVNNGKHYVMLANAESKSKGQLYCYDSWSDRGSVAPQLLSRYTSWNAAYTYQCKAAVDTVAPTISNVNVSNVTKDGYTVSCTVNDNVGVTKVLFPSWNNDIHKGENAVWLNGTISGNTASVTVKISELKSGAIEGNYVTHIYAYDAAGNSKISGINPVYIGKTEPTTTGSPAETTPPTPTKEPSTETTPPTPTKEPSTETTSPTPTKEPSTETGDNNKVTVKKPGKVSGLSAKNIKGKKMFLSWKSQPNAAGYQIQYAQNNKFISKKSYNVGQYTTSKTFTGLKKGKTYYIRVRAYNRGAGITTYGSWSVVKKVKIKK